MKNVSSIVALSVLTLPATLNAQELPLHSMMAQQQAEANGLVMELGMGEILLVLFLTLTYIGIWIGSIVSVVKHPFESWIPKLIWLICILVFELPASFVWFILRPRRSRPPQIPPLARDPLAAKAPMPEKVVMPKK